MDTNTKRILSSSFEMGASWTAGPKNKDLQEY